MTAGPAASRRVLARTPGGHQRENVPAARQLSPRSVQFSVAQSVQFSVAIDIVSRQTNDRPSIIAQTSRPEPSSATRPRTSGRGPGLAQWGAIPDVQQRVEPDLQHVMTCHDTPEAHVRKSKEAYPMCYIGLASGPMRPPSNPQDPDAPSRCFAAHRDRSRPRERGRAGRVAGQGRHGWRATVRLVAGGDGADAHLDRPGCRGRARAHPRAGADPAAT